MKSSLRFPSFLTAWIKQSLHSVKEDFRRWAPQQAPVLVPIPIRAEHLTRHSDRRQFTRRD